MNLRINLPSIPAGKRQERKPHGQYEPCHSVTRYYHKPISSYGKEGTPAVIFPDSHPSCNSGTSFILISKPFPIPIARRRANRRDANGTRLPRIRKQTLQLQSNVGIVTNSDRGGDKQCPRKHFKSTVATKPESLLARSRLLLPPLSESANKQRKLSGLLVCSNCLAHSENSCSREPQLSNESVMSQRRSSVNNFSTALAQLSA